VPAPFLATHEGRPYSDHLLLQEDRKVKVAHDRHWLRILLVPRLRLGRHTFRALPGQWIGLSMIMEAEPPGQAFSGRAGEREKMIILFQQAS